MDTVLLLVKGYCITQCLMYLYAVYATPGDEKIANNFYKMFCLFKPLHLPVKPLVPTTTASFQRLGKSGSDSEFIVHLKFSDVKHPKLHHSKRRQSSRPRRWFTHIDSQINKLLSEAKITRDSGRSSLGRVDYYSQDGKQRVDHYQPLHTPKLHKHSIYTE